MLFVSVVVIVGKSKSDLHERCQPLDCLLIMGRGSEEGTLDVKIFREILRETQQ